MSYIVRGTFPSKPPKSVWWGIEVFDGRDWLKCDLVEERPAGKSGKKGKKTVRWWPTTTIPTPELIGESWHSGWYRITWTAHDKRARLQVSEAFAVLDTDDPQVVNLLNAQGGGPVDRNKLNPEELMNLPPHMAPAAAELRCTHCGRSEAETPMSMFTTMFVLMDKHMDRQAHAMRNQHELALADLRSNQSVALEQTRLFFGKMHEMSLAPRLAALESRLADLYDEDGDMDMADPTTAAIVASLLKETVPTGVLLAQRYLEGKKTPKLDKGDDEGGNGG